MVCKNCGMENAEDFAFCAGCGATLNEVEAAPEETVAPEYNYTAEAFEDEVPASDPGKVFGIIALICGIAAILLFFVCICACGGCLGTMPTILCGIAGIILGIVGMNKSKAAGYKNTMGVIGMILSIVALVICILISIVSAFTLGISGFMSAMDSSSYYY